MTQPSLRWPKPLSLVCNQLLASVVGASARFWRYYSQILNEYAESLLDVAEVRRTNAPISRSTFERLLAQSRPLVIPSAALLDRADSWHLCDHLEEFVLTATASSQLFNDLTDLYRDRDRGHRTWTTDIVGESAADELWLEVAGEASNEQQAGRISERIRTALSFHERSARAARALELTAAGTWLTDRQAALEGLLGSLRGNLLATFVQADGRIRASWTLLDANMARPRKGCAMRMDDGYLDDIPSELVVRAQQNMEFALRLLDPGNASGGDQRARVS